MKKQISALYTLVALIVLLNLAIHAQESGHPAVPDEDEIIKIETQLVPLSLRATDHNGRVLPVNKSDLQLSVDGRVQTISYFEIEPVVHYAILLDVSSSMRGKKSERAINALGWMLSAAAENQRFDIYTFADAIHYVGEFRSKDENKLHKTLNDLKPQGETALYDAALEVTRKLQSESDSSALIVLTDGEDSASKTKPATLQAALGVRNGLTYLIMFNNQLGLREEHAFRDDGEADKAGREFQKVFQSVLFLPTDRGNLKRVVENIPREATGIIRLGFIPGESAGTSGGHQIAIRSSNKHAELVYRNSYFIAPTEQIAVNR